MDKLRIAIVGLGFGRHIIKELSEPPNSDLFEIAMVCDLNEDSARETAQSLGVPFTCSLDVVLQDASIPAIGLFTGPAGRANLLRKIIQSGKDVMTTKPFEVNPEAALAVLREARQLKRVIHLNSPSPVPTADLKQMQDWIEKYQLGRPIACRADTWCNYREIGGKDSWYDNPETCPVAPVFRLGIYLINDLIRFLGEPQQVQVFGTRIFTGRPTPDNGQLSIRFKNGALANVFASFCVNDGDCYKNALVMNFENGTIYRNTGPLGKTGIEPRCELLLKTCSIGKEINMERVIVEEISGDYQWKAFYNAVNGKGITEEITPEFIANGLKVIRAMALSEKSRKTEDIT